MEKFDNPPIVEAIVEIRWELKSKTQIGSYDPNYTFFLGTFRNAFKSSYPFHEALPASNIPDEMSGYTVKHRFRKTEEGWPLIQIGPGIVTLNETEKYETFEAFKPKAMELVEKLFNSYPEKDDLRINMLKLRYIDAVEFDYTENSIYDFLSKMHMRVNRPSVLLLNKIIEELPVSYSSKTSFRCNTPPGVGTFTIATGHKYKKRAVIWNQILKSSDIDVPEMPSGFGKWLDQAHDVIYKWFSNVIKGDLRKSFNNE